MRKCAASGVDDQGPWECDAPCRTYTTPNGDVRHHRWCGVHKATSERNRRRKCKPYRQRHPAQFPNAADMFSDVRDDEAVCRQCGKVKPRSAFSRNSQLKNGLQPRCKACLADKFLDDTYGEGAAEWKKARLEANGGTCDLCGTDEPGNKNGWSLDHDHAKPKGRGSWRGMLCIMCNTTIGRMELLKKAGLLDKALSYIEDGGVV